MRNDKTLLWEPVHLCRASQESSVLSGYSLPPRSEPQFYRIETHYQCPHNVKILRLLTHHKFKGDR